MVRRMVMRRATVMRLATAAIPAARISRSDRDNAHLIDSKSVRGDIVPAA
jgi:hypothetical protein